MKPQETFCLATFHCHVYDSQRGHKALMLRWLPSERTPVANGRSCNKRRKERKGVRLQSLVVHTVARKSLAREHRARFSCDHVPVIAKKIYFTSYNIQNQYTSHIDHKRLRGIALKLCLLRGEQLYLRGNFVMGGLYVWEANICKV